VVIAIIGPPPVAPWQLFFQQSGVADKHDGACPTGNGSLDTFLGAGFSPSRLQEHMIIVGNVSHQQGLTYEDRQKMATPDFGPFTKQLVRNAIL